MSAANEALFEPFAGEHPAGLPLYYEPIYDSIREARREDDQNLSQGIWETSFKKADWHQVELLCYEALTKQSKDLQIALWLVESWVMQRGWPALVEGFLFLRDFSEAHWTTMHPKIATDGTMEHRLSPLFLFAEKMPSRLVLLPLGTSETTLSSWRMAQYQTKIGKKTNEAQQFLIKVLLAIPHDVLKNLHATLAEAEDALKNLCITLDALSHNASPSFKSISETLREAKVLLENTWRRTQSTLKTADSPQQEKKTQPESQVRKEISEDPAYQELEKLAQFFEERHASSPIPLLLKSALVVAKIPFGTLLEQAAGETESPIACITRLWTLLKQLES
ncbi:MAG: type VI secretion system protein TssA [Holosporales bacterium]|jgi:type VI secretion system ImpA family protein|nr:type VI secretion system protein TssA [Holosporales bacterium]